MSNIRSNKPQPKNLKVAFLDNVPATPKQVAMHYSVTTPTVLRWWREGIIPAKIALGRVYRFDLREVEEALAKHSEQGGQGA